MVTPRAFPCSKVIEVHLGGAGKVVHAVASKHSRLRCPVKCGEHYAVCHTHQMEIAAFLGDNQVV